MHRLVVFISILAFCIAIILFVIGLGRKTDPLVAFVNGFILVIVANIPEVREQRHKQGDSPDAAKRQHRLLLLVDLSTFGCCALLVVHGLCSSVTDLCQPSLYTHEQPVTVTTPCSSIPHVKLP